MLLTTTNIHSWRSQFRSNTLFAEINFVLDRFCKPHLELFKHVDTLLSTPAGQPLPPNASLPLLAQALQLLIQIFYDLTCQDLPPFIEDNMAQFMGEGDQPGWLLKYLSWERPELKGDDDDEAPGPLQKIRASICEIAELFAMKYSDAFPQLGSFVNGVWQMLTTVSTSTREDVVSNIASAVSCLTPSLSRARSASCRSSSRWAATARCSPPSTLSTTSARRSSFPT
jgi:exportin-2 (importin alpha re-exporter)